jgi:hypothetical protein
MADINAIPVKSRVEPSIPASDPRFVWTTGADVQATWRRFGWTPPSAGRTQFFEEPAPTPVQILKFKVV